MNVTSTEPDLLFTELWKSCASLDVALANILIGDILKDINSWFSLVLP